MTEDEQIRNSCRGLILGQYPTDRVWPYLVLGHEASEWPALLRADDGIVRGWMIFRTGAVADWKNNQRDRRFFSYGIWAFYAFRSGKIGDNSDREFNERLDTVYGEFKSAPTLNLQFVAQHNLLQWQRITTVKTGEEILHWAEGSLRVELC